MREIEFRGKRTDNGEWIFGGAVCNTSGEVFIEAVDFFHTMVDTETVGQYTGVKDKNGVRIFEGDIVNIWSPEYLPEKIPEKEPAVIKWEQFSCSFMLFDTERECVPVSWFNGNLDELRMDVTGNIHDNPELLNGKEGAE